MIVPLLDDGRLVVERQFRYPMQRVMLEFPAGKLDAGEEPLALRDPRTGRGNRLSGTPMGTCRHPAQRDRLFERRHRGLVRARPEAGPAHLDAGEFLEVDTASLDELEALRRAAS